MVIGTFGAQNAGKTTLLAAWYTLLGKGSARFDTYQFAGSFTLDGWEAVAGALRWAPGQAPGFPPHTTSRSGRAPGMLHLTFHDKARARYLDYLFTDAPGEWFQRWATNSEAPEAEGARWTAEHADVLLLIADREALSGERKGTARGALQRLAIRLAAERRARPVALVWTKSDIEIAPQMREAVHRIVAEHMPDVAEFSVSIRAETDPSWSELLHWILRARRPSMLLPPATAVSGDPLFLYGARTS